MVKKSIFVGHSLGGVIGRVWTQENSAKVGKIVTLASPNYGSLKAYEMWSGAKVSNPTDLSSIAINVLLALQKKNNLTLVQTVRNYLPAMIDLVPTFNYLKKSGIIISPPENTYLSTKNSGVGAIYNQLLAVGGKGEVTSEWINLGERNVFDVMLGRWEQGRPVNYTLGEGDGTVLTKSSIFADDNKIMLTASHGQVPDKSVNIVLSELGLGKTISITADSNFEGAVFYMGSPASMKVNCGSGEINETEGFVLVSNRNISDCNVKLSGKENGIYHLVMGNSGDDESWKYVEGNISIGETKYSTVNLVDFWYEQLLWQTNLLLDQFPGNSNLLNMKMAILAKNRVNLLNYYYLFRKQKLETVITWQMVNNLEKIINIELPVPTVTLINAAKNNALAAKSLADKTASLLQRQKIFPNMWQSLNYSQGEELFAAANYGKYLIAEKVFGMVWY